MDQTFFKNAIVRKPAPNFAAGLTTQDNRGANYTLMSQQHAAYVAKLQELGLAVTILPANAEFPDGHFVEDPVVFAGGTAVLTRPGAPSRLHEGLSLTETLAGFADLARIEAPGFLDGGDVMRVRDHFYIGLSDRTNEAGAEQLGALVSEQGFTWSTVAVPAGLHLKSSVNYLGDNVLLGTESFLALPEFADFEKWVLPPEETPAANTLWINENLLMPAGYPKTEARLRAWRKPVHVLDMSEVEKMDGGLSCLSLRF
ncbi:arginine deiminase-related protein [Acanthopleuribacter pedis]|uniref:Amidinotransferase n=1 Tax=Acanthopleuribacter pedis TaxID=442870 RepID=A0A8J7PZU5_9BACT|nr:arginine deiminase-related protein [Acanthopleuribacter pedis]MBO1317782.1 hypothetical protein [Acanthopleuribacter pedis]